MGRQLFVQGTMKPSEKLMVGAQFLYAQGTDDADEDQIHTLTDGATSADLDSFVPFDYGIMNTWLCPTNHAFELVDDAGSIALNVIGDFTIAEGILLQGSLGYAVPEEDKTAAGAKVALDSAIIFNIGVTFDVATNAKFGVQYNHFSPDMNNGLEEDDARALMARFSLNF